ncbi:peroxisome proliferator-activated receptor gamma coactivator 1-alpha isoform X1 [Hemibagrus wyckioides]|uniref:peroxisome proliferator-activated receptor gamma coactivator 1-alpha isoform X1 n=1 Tax=Hemibagrus wyckioides TaxID=337641 RepID=UPI00266D3F29|nr:peroxisome proliferator-activated receptor gamma coactivator 1-alpha isoform X1 [Hemibagrus wyckioides]
MAWDRCNQESVWTELECAALVGEDQPLCPDLPELDLSELDVSDLDADSFLGGLKWYSDQSEIISSQYGNESSNLFEKIDEENEANLLAVLTETLDSIPVDEDGLPSFEALADGDVTNASDQSCPSTPDGSPRTPEPEEPSLLKKLLLAPPNSQLSYNQYPGSKAQNHAASNHRIRPTPAVTKTDNPWNSKQRGVFPQPNRLVRRPCTELLKYLTASDDAFQTRASEAKSTWSGCDKDRGGPGTSSCSSSSSPSSSSTSSFSSLSSCSSSTASKKKPSSASLSTQQQQQQQLAVQAQRGESQAAGAYSVAGEGAGQWRRCTHGEQSTPVVPSCGSGCSHACSSEEGRPPQGADTGSLAAARFIRYMHSYSLPPREMGRAGSCGRCLEAGGWAGASRADRHITITIRKRRQEQEHPMLSQLLTSRPRPARYRAHLQMPIVAQTDKQDPPKTPPRDKGWDWHVVKDSQGHQIINPILDSQEPSQANSSDLELSTLVDLDLECVLMQFEQDIGRSKIKMGQNGVDVHDDFLGSPLSIPGGLPSPLFQDSLVPEHPPSTIQEQNPHRQADCKHPDDQVPPPLAKPTTLPLPLTPESPNDHKGSPFENKTIERTLSVEISGTPGLTPPTTPPHKASQENLFKVSLKTKLSSASSALTNKKAKLSNGSPSSLPFSSSSRKAHEKSELYAQLSKASSALPLGNLEECRGKRPTPRVFGDHDYCQASSTKRDNGTSAATITGPVEGRHVEPKDSTMPAFSNLTSSLSSTSPLSSSLARQLQGLCPMVQEACPDKEAQGQDNSPALGAKTSKECISAGRKLLRDQEIREELNKHFGNPQQAFFSETEQSEFQPLDESDSGDENYYPFEAYMDTGLPDFEDLEVGRERLLCSWEGTPLEMLFEGSPPCSPSSSLPSQSSVSPPSTLLSPRHFYNSQSGSRSRSRSRSSSRHRYRSLSRSPYSCSQSPDNCSPSWSHHTVDKSTFKSRTIRSPQSDSHSGLAQRPRYDSYEEYQHEQLQREEYQRDYEKREVERAEQREKQRKRAIEERRVLYVGRLRADSTRSELKRRFEVFGEIEECAINLRHNGDNFGFITYRYTCDAFAALENGHTLRRPNEPQFKLCFGGQKQFCKSNYTDLDSHSEDFDPTSTKSKYDSMDFDSLLREAQCSLRR